MTQLAPARPALRLPAPPPAKRLKTQLGQAAPPGAAAEAAPEPPAAAAAVAATADAADSPVNDNTVQEEDAAEALPNDTMVALLLLRSRFPPEAKVTPFATRAQLYSLLSDRTATDRQLEELRRCNQVRLLQLPIGGRGDDHAVMLTSDYIAALRRGKAQLLKQHQERQQQAGGSTGGAASGSGGGCAPAGVTVFGWFARRVLPACTEVLITHSELLALLSGTGGAPPGGAARNRSGGALHSNAAAAAAGNAVAAVSAVTDAHVSLLLNHGFLNRSTASSDSYLFSMPHAGAAVRSVAAGRQEVLSLLQRRRHPELLENELEKRKLQRSVLGVRWHVADMVGGGALLRIGTAVGPMLRVAKRGG